MQKVLTTKTTKPHPTTTPSEIIEKLQQNTSNQVEANRTHQLITDIISQFKLLMEYLPEYYQNLEETLNQLLKIQHHIEVNISAINFEFEELKIKVEENQTPCNCGGGCV